MNLNTQGAFRGVLGGHKSKSLGGCQTAGPIGTAFGRCLRIRLGMDIGSTIRPSTLGGGVRGTQIQKLGEDVKRLVRLAPNLVHMCRFIWEWIYAKQFAPRDTKGHLGGGLGGQTFKSHGKLSNGWTDWHQLWFTSVDSSGNINTSRPSIPQGGWRGGGGVRGSQIQKSWEAVKRLDRLAPNLVHVCGFIWEWT